VRGDVVSLPARDAEDRRLERRILERLHLPAVVADEVVMVVARGVDALESRDAVTKVDSLHEAELAETLERSVHARDPEPRAAGANRVVDLLGGDAAVLPVEVVDDDAPCGARAPARVAESRERDRCPSLR